MYLSITVSRAVSLESLSSRGRCGIPLWAVLLLKHPELEARSALHAHIVGAQLGGRALGSLLRISLALLLSLGSLKCPSAQRRSRMGRGGETVRCRHPC